MDSGAWKFQITNGMNLFTLSRGFRRGTLTYAIGAGFEPVRPTEPKEAAP
jgi:hypothetical protein